MNHLKSSDWVEARVLETAALWTSCAGGRLPNAMCYTVAEQRRREKAWDGGRRAVERELRRARKNRSAPARQETQRRVTSAFARFSAVALHLNDDAIDLLTNEFLPAATKLARWARVFDPSLSMADIIQACRNAWTACGLQPLLGMRVELTPSILGYSLLYPYSDNYLDGENVTGAAKLEFSGRFRERLRGGMPTAADEREAAISRLVELIEGQYPRAVYPEVFECLLAIHQAQEASLSQVNSRCPDEELLRMSCAKGGTSVMADACLARGWMSEDESRFSFEWGVLLQLGDDLQDVHEDRKRGSATLFSRPAARGERLDDRATQLLNFAERVGEHMEQLPSGSAMLKSLLRMSWRSLILMAVAEAHQHFSPAFLAEAERFSPFRFAFLRERRETMIGQGGLYGRLFDAFAAQEDGEPDVCFPVPRIRPALAARALPSESPAL